MIIQRIRKYSFSPSRFVGGILPFVFDWFRYRPLQKLITGMIPVALTIYLLTLMYQSTTAEYQETLASQYDQLAIQALENQELESSDLYFSRSIVLATDKSARSFAIAKTFYEHREYQRAMDMMSSLAPLKSRGYVPAHQFLSKHWQTATPQSDVTRALSMFHEMYAEDTQEAPKIRLASFLSDRGYQPEALNCLDNLLHPSPKVRLLRVQIHTRSSDKRSAMREAKQAESELRQQVANDNSNHAARILLSRAIGCQQRILDAVFLLAKGLETQDSPQLTDELVKCYILWLTPMSAQQKQRQVHEIALALQIESADEAETEALELSSGRQISMPVPIVRFHERLKSGEGRWLISLLQGTDLASEQHYAAAITKLESALSQSPNNALIENNLAWTLMKQDAEAVAVANDTSDNSATSKEALQRAWKLANAAVEDQPEEASFRETRGQLAERLGRWQTAVDDLTLCVKLGYNSAAIQATLTRARKSL